MRLSYKVPIVEFCLLFSTLSLLSQASSMGGKHAEEAGRAAQDAAVDSLSPNDYAEVKALYTQLTEAENAHNSDAVKKLIWKSPYALLVSKSSDPEDGNWSGVWGDEIVAQHIHDLLQGTFHIEPDYQKVKVAGLTHDVAETYSPVHISVSYGGQNPVPKPFLIIIEWVRTLEGWKMASDIALPVPPFDATK